MSEQGASHGPIHAVPSHGTTVALGAAVTQTVRVGVRVGDVQVRVHGVWCTWYVYMGGVDPKGQAPTPTTAPVGPVVRSRGGDVASATSGTGHPAPRTCLLVGAATPGSNGSQAIWVLSAHPHVCTVASRGAPSGPWRLHPVAEALPPPVLTASTCARAGRATYTHHVPSPHFSFGLVRTLGKGREDKGLEGPQSCASWEIHKR